jgi:hypothetical protein
MNQLFFGVALLPLLLVGFRFEYSSPHTGKEHLPAPSVWEYGTQVQAEQGFPPQCKRNEPATLRH